MQCICEHFVLQGEKCSNCNKKLHFHCLRDCLARSRTDSFLCPFCREPDTFCLPVESRQRGEKRKSANSTATSAQPATGGRRASRRRTAQATEAEDDEVEDEGRSYASP